MSLIILDVGSDTIKYSQPKMNINEISEFLGSQKSNYSNEENDDVNIDITPYDRGDEIVFNADKNNNYNDNVNTKFRKNEKTIKNKLNKDQQDFLSQLNPNNIFENNCFLKTVPTILFNNNIEKLLFNKNFEIENTIKGLLSNTSGGNFIDLESDFFSSKCDFNLSSLKLDNELIYSGVINDFNKWENIIDFIGSDFSKNKYNKELLNSNPLLITQKTLDFYTLQSQTQKQYEILFEKKMCPFSLITSQALMILLSFNQLTGIVVDIGESGTTISVVVDGITQYNNSIHLPIMSGRMMNIYSILNSRDENSKLVSDYNLKVTQEEILNSKYQDNKSKTNPYMMNSIFSYTECFKLLLNPKYTIKNKTELKRLNGTCIKENINYLNKFVHSYEENSDIEAFFDKLSNTDFNSIILNYRENNCIESSALTFNNKLMRNINNLQNGYFKQLNLVYHIYSVIGKAISLNPDYETQLMNVYFSGGVLNNKELVEIIKADFNFFSKNDNNIKLNFSINDPQTSSFKGFNFMSKLNNYENIFVSQKDYYEYGSEHLSFNYI